MNKKYFEHGDVIEIESKSNPETSGKYVIDCTSKSGERISLVKMSPVFGVWEMSKADE